jgi:hypothetical protein
MISPFRTRIEVKTYFVSVVDKISALMNVLQWERAYFLQAAKGFSTASDAVLFFHTWQRAVYYLSLECN